MACSRKCYATNLEGDKQPLMVSTQNQLSFQIPLIRLLTVINKFSILLNSSRSELQKKYVTHTNWLPHIYVPIEMTLIIKIYVPQLICLFLLIVRLIIIGELQRDLNQYAVLIYCHEDPRRRRGSVACRTQPCLLSHCNWCNTNLNNKSTCK